MGKYRDQAIGSRRGYAAVGHSKGRAQMKINGLCTDCQRAGSVEVIGLVCDRSGASAKPTGLCSDCRTRRHLLHT